MKFDFSGKLKAGLERGKAMFNGIANGKTTKCVDCDAPDSTDYMTKNPDGAGYLCDKCVQDRDIGQKGRQNPFKNTSGLERGNAMFKNKLAKGLKIGSVKVSDDDQCNKCGKMIPKGSNAKATYEPEFGGSLSEGSWEALFCMACADKLDLKNGIDSKCVMCKKKLKADEGDEIEGELYCVKCADKKVASMENSSAEAKELAQEIYKCSWDSCTDAEKKDLEAIAKDRQKARKNSDHHKNCPAAASGNADDCTCADRENEIGLGKCSGCGGELTSVGVSGECTDTKCPEYRDRKKRKVYGTTKNSIAGNGPKTEQELIDAITRTKNKLMPGDPKNHPLRTELEMLQLDLEDLRREKKNAIPIECPDCGHGMEQDGPRKIAMCHNPNCECPACLKGLPIENAPPKGTSYKCNQCSFSTDNLDAAVNHETQTANKHDMMMFMDDENKNSRSAPPDCELCGGGNTPDTGSLVPMKDAQENVWFVCKQCAKDPAQELHNRENALSDKKCPKCGGVTAVVTSDGKRACMDCRWDERNIVQNSDTSISAGLARGKAQFSSKENAMCPQADDADEPTTCSKGKELAKKAGYNNSTRPEQLGPCVNCGASAAACRKSAGVCCGLCAHHNLENADSSISAGLARGKAQFGNADLPRERQRQLSQAASGALEEQEYGDMPKIAGADLVDFVSGQPGIGELSPADRKYIKSLANSNHADDKKSRFAEAQKLMDQASDYAEEARNLAKPYIQLLKEGKVSEADAMDRRVKELKKKEDALIDKAIDLRQNSSPKICSYPDCGKTAKYETRHEGGTSYQCSDHGGPYSQPIRNASGLVVGDLVKIKRDGKIARVSGFTGVANPVILKDDDTEQELGLYKENELSKVKMDRLGGKAENSPEYPTTFCRIAQASSAAHRNTVLK